MNKKILFIAIILIVLCSLSAVSASEINSAAENDCSDSELLSVPSISTDTVYMLSNSNVNFTKLNETISKAGNSVSLDSNVNLGVNESNLFKDGITINKTLTIDGNGYTINATCADGTQARIFNVVNNATLTLKNINIEGAYYSSNGGAIYVDSYSNLILNDVIVSENAAVKYGGAIYLNSYANLTATDVIFKKNRATGGDTRGGAIYAKTYTNVKLVNTTFEDNTVNGVVSSSYYSTYGGSIYLDSYSDMKIINSSFLDTYRDVPFAVDGGIIYVNSRSNLTVSNSLFENITLKHSRDGNRYFASNDNGLIRCNDYVILNVTDTVFKDNNNINGGHSYAYGNGLIHSTGSNSQNYITNCIFINNTADRVSAIQTRNADIISCIFINNSVNDDYPEIYYEGNGKGSISHNVFLGDGTSIRILNSAANVIEAENWWGTNNPGEFVRIQNDYQAPNNYVVMSVYNEGNTVYATLTRNSGGDFIENPELLPIRTAVFEASATTTLNTTNAMASTVVDDSEVNVTIDDETVTHVMAQGNISSIEIASVENTSAGADGAIYFVLTGDNGPVDGELTVMVNDKKYTGQISKGLATINLGNDFLPDVYDIYYIYEGGENYAAIPTKTKADEQFEVYKNDVTITYTRDKNIITFNVAGDNGIVPTGTINVTVGDINKVFTLSNGAASYNYGNDLEPNKYDVNVTYLGDDYNNEGNLITTVDIIKYNVEITFTNVTNQLTFNVAGVNDVMPTGSITVTLGNVTETFALKNGAASYDFGKVSSAGNYNLTVNYTGDDYYNPNVMTSTFEVVKMTPNVTLTIENLDLKKGDRTRFVVTVTGDENIATGRFTLNIGTYSRSTSLSGGTRSFNWGNSFSAGYYDSIILNYEGDGYYDPATYVYNGTLIVHPNIQIEAPTEVFSDKVPVSITFDDDKLNGTLIVKMDGVEVFDDEIDSDSLNLLLTNVEAGEHTFEAFFVGNEKYPSGEGSYTTDISYPEMPQWSQEGYDYTNSGQSPYVRLNEVIELWNYTGDGNSLRGTPLIDKDGNIIITFKNKFITLSNNGTVIKSKSGSVPGYALDYRGILITPKPGNRLEFVSSGEEIYIEVYGDLYPLSEINNAVNMWMDSSNYAAVIGPDGSLYVTTQYDYGGWVSIIKWEENYMGFEFYSDHEMILPIPDISYGSNPHIAPVTLDNSGNLWHTSKTGLRGVVISSNTIAFQDPNIGTKGRAVVDANDIVYAFGNDDKIYAVKMSGILWNATVTGGAGSTMVVGKDSEYILSVNSEGVLYKYDATDGKETKIFDFNTTVSSALMTDANGVIYVGDDDGTFWALSDNGTVLWKFDAGSAIVGLPSMDKNGVIYIYTADKVVFALGTNKANSTISLEVNDTTTVEGLTAIATLPENATGDVVFTLSNGESYNVEIINGTATLFLDDILSGDYNITAVYGGNYAFNGNETNATFTVTKVNATIEINVTEIYPDINGTIVITIANATGDVVVKVEGLNDTTETLVDGVANVTLPVLKEGVYNITVEYAGDETFFNATETSEFEVIKYTTEIQIAIDNVTVIENATLTVTVTNATGKVTVNVDGDEETYDLDENGTAIIDLGLFAAGTHNVTVTYNGNDLFYEITNETSFDVSKISTPLIVDIDADVAFEDVIVTVEVDEYATGNITVTVNGKDYSGEISNESIAEIIIPGLGAGEYNATITYDGNDKVESNSTTESFEVDKIYDYEVELTEDVYATSEGTITVELPEGTSGNVTITIGEDTFTGEVINGTAVVDIPAMEPGEYEYYVEYSGDDNYYGTEEDGFFVVTKEDVKLDIDVEDDTVSVTLPEDAGGYLLVDVNGTGFWAPVEDGAADVTVFGLEPGNYTANIIYTGDVNYNPANATATIEIPEIIPEDAELTVIVNDTLVTISLNENATGYVVVSVAGEDFYYELDGEDIVVDLFGYEPGNYTVDVSYSGDDVFAADNATATVVIPEVIPEDANITVNVTDGEISVELPEDATGYVIVSVDGKDYFFEAGDDIELDLSDLAPGEYPVIVSYSGDDKYDQATANATLTIPEVIPEDANLTATAENATITVTLNENATGNILVDVEGTGYYAEIEDGEAVIEVIGLEPGDYEAVVTYLGDEVFAPANATVTITVPKDEPVDPEADIEVGNETISVELPEDATGYLLVDVDGKGYYAPVKDGKASVELPELAPGNYTVTVTYTGDAKYASVSATENITVEVVETIISEDLTKVEKAPDKFEATFTDKNGNALANTKVTFEIQGGEYTRTTDANGKAAMAINLEAGNYTIKMTNPVTGEVKTNNITVLSRFQDANDLVKYFRNDTQYVIKVLGDDGNIAPVGTVVTFNINGVFYNRTVNATGHVKLNINLNPGEYIITGECKGCLVSNKVTVLPILTGKDMTKKYGEPGAYEVKLVDGQGKPYAGQSINLNINGVFYDRTTNSDGIAKLNINLMPGQYIITATYGYAAISNTVTVTA